MVKYKSDLGKYNLLKEEDHELVTRAEDVKAASTVTAYESQLARCFGKVGDEKVKAVRRYMNLYASVKPTLVLPQFLVEANRVIG